MRAGSGACRDIAVLLAELLREMGLAARLVSGYLRESDTKTRRAEGSLHAWTEVFLPGAGWVEFDPTNGIIGSKDLIRVGVARDPRQAIPLWGTHTGRRNDSLGMSVQVNVTTAAADGSVNPAPPEDP